MQMRSNANIIPFTKPTAGLLTNFDWWTKLTGPERVLVQQESTELARHLIHWGQAKLSIGEHLTKLQAVLEPKGLFGQYLKVFHFSTRTAYRYINGFENASEALPEVIVKSAMARGLNLLGDSEEKPLGVYTKIVQSMPPPKNPSPVQAAKYVERIEQARKDTRSRGSKRKHKAKDNSWQQCYDFVRTKFERQPEETRKEWLQGLLGKLEALGQRRRPGRPRTIAVAA